MIALWSPAVGRRAALVAETIEIYDEIERLLDGRL